MAEDDDDDSFGEFTFASNHPTVNSASQIPVTTGDDEWGDFNFFQNDTTDHNLKSPPSQPQTQIEAQTQPKWEKIKGALPLSLFGDDDEEDDKPAMPVAGEDVKLSNYSGNNGLVTNNKSDKSNAHMYMNDLLANLYSQSQQQQSIKADDNGNNLDLSTINTTFTKDANTSSDVFSSFSLHTVTPGAGNHGSDDEGGWEFIDAFSDSKLTQIGKDNKERLEKEKPVSSPGLQDCARSSIDLFAAPNNEVPFEYNVTHSGLNANSVTNFQNGFSANSKADSEGATHELSSNLHSGSDDFDDTFGEFETAYTEQPSTKKELSEESKGTLGSHDASHRPVDLFAFSNGVHEGSHRNNNGFDLSQSSVFQNGVSSDSLSQIGWMETKDDSDSQTPGWGSDDGSLGKFETTFPEAGLKQEGSVASSKNYREPVPLSIFGIEEDPQADSSMIIQQDLFKSSTHGKHTRNQSSSLSIDDISDLYSQAEPFSSANHEPNPDGKVNLLHSIGKEYSPRIVDDDDDFDDGSWEFKDASSQPRVEHQNMSFKEKLENFKNFYSNMKDDLCVVARHHVHGLKKAQNTTALVGEEIRVASLDKEIQEALEELRQKDIIPAENDSDDNSEKVISLKQYIETLNEPSFQVFESEYHLLRRLSLAESDLRTTIDLINHISTVLKILALAPKGELPNYVSLWFKMISVCSQELKHGTWILKQSLEKNVHSELLSEEKGEQFIIALGEIYRAVLILGTSVKFYKPWILLSDADVDGIHGLLEECDSVWSTSGLQEVIPVESLLESIGRIRNLDELASANEFLSKEESQCRLSLLSPGVVPEMKMVRWNGDNYFLALANLWANLISPDPPKLTIHVG